MLRCQQTPASRIQRIHRIRLAGNGLNAVQYTGNQMMLALKPVVNVTVMMIIGRTQTENQAIPAVIIFCKLRNRYNLLIQDFRAEKSLFLHLVR